MAERSGSQRAALTGHYGRPDDPPLRYRIEVAIGVAENLLHLAFKSDPEGDPRILAELKILLTRYLELDRLPADVRPARLRGPGRAR